MPRRLRRFPLFLLCCLLLANLSSEAQTPPLPNALLWRITGPHSARPSYLWGTIHIKDRRVFHFTDSLYRALESADAYAMELDIEEMSSVLTNFYAQTDTSALISTLLSPADFRRVAKKLEKELKRPAASITRKDVYVYLENRFDPPQRKDDMQEPMDLYLYTIARSLGKQLSGIEDVRDQFDPATELAQPIDVEEVLHHRLAPPAQLETIVQVYLNKDLDKLLALTEHYDSTSRAWLQRRNVKMARRLDSLMQLRPTFFTMGAAHLPGNKGMIALLRGRGYRVEPVTGGTALAPGDYHFERPATVWTAVRNDSATYEVSFPGKAESQTDPMNGTFTQVYADLHSERMYMVMAGVVPEGLSADSLLRQRFAQVTSNSKLISPVTALQYEGRTGLEATLLDKSGMYLRMRGLPNGDEIVLLVSGSKTRKSPDDSDIQYFYKSLHFLRPSTRNYSTGWVRYHDERIGYNLLFPQPPERDAPMLSDMQQNVETSWRSETRSYFDPVKQMLYLVFVRETKPGFSIPDGRGLLAGILENYQAGTNGYRLRWADTGTVDGMPYLRLAAMQTANKVIVRVQEVVRGNRHYTLFASAEKDDSLSAERFFNSLHFEPYPVPAWSLRTDSAGRFRAATPVPFVRTGGDTTAYGSADRLAAYDSVRNLSYYVDLQPQSRFRHFTSDSAFYAYWKRIYKERDDSLVSDQPVQNGASSGREFRFHSATGYVEQRYRVLPFGDSVAVMFVQLPLNELDGAADTVFNSFRIGKDGSWRRDAATTEALLAALRGTDSLLRSDAEQYLRVAASFTRADLPQLHAALLYPYYDFDSATVTIHDQLLREVRNLHDPSTVTFLPGAYRGLEPGSRLHLSLLGLLAQQQSAPAFDSLKQLLLLGPPPAGFNNVLTDALLDSPLLTRRLFPEAGYLFRDSISTDWLLPAVGNLLDSGLLQAGDLAPWSNDLMREARRYLANDSANGNVSYRLLFSTVKWLGFVHTPAANALLQSLLKREPSEVQVKAAEELLRNGQPVAPASLLRLAASHETRASLYEMLQRRKRPDLFSAKYRSQQSLAETAVYNSVSEDYTVQRLVYAGSRERMLKGQKRRFFLFRVYVEGGEKGGYAAVAGPFSTDAGELTNDDVWALMSEAKFGATTQEALVESFVKTNSGEDEP